MIFKIMYGGFMNLFPGYKLNKEEQKVTMLASLGGMLEFYDFTIYGLFAVYFAHQFFPTHNETIALIASYSVFVVGYVVRPIGGVIFSHIGDEVGRKTVLIITMVLMGISSFGMGILPNYESIGVFAPALMLFFRLLQGLAIGGELPSMIVYSSETIPEKRGYAMGGVFAGTICGLIPGMIINLLILHFLTKEQIDSFGWRIPFLFGGFLCVIAYFVRKELHETNAFKQIKQHIGIPFIHVLTHYFGRVIIGVGLVSIMATPIILLIIFMPTYLVKIAHVDATIAGDASLVAAIFSVIFVYIGGIVAQKYNLVKSMFVCLFFIVITACICYWTISLNNTMIFVGIGLFAVFQGVLVVLPAVAISYLFPTDVRLTGVALSYNISFVLFGGLTPIFVTALIAETNLVYVIPVAILTLVSLFAALSVYKTKPYIK